MDCPLRILLDSLLSIVLSIEDEDREDSCCWSCFGRVLAVAVLFDELAAFFLDLLFLLLDDEDAVVVPAETFVAVLDDAVFAIEEAVFDAEAGCCSSSEDSPLLATVCFQAKHRRSIYIYIIQGKGGFIMNSKQKKIIFFSKRGSQKWDSQGLRQVTSLPSTTTGTDSTYTDQSETVAAGGQHLSDLYRTLCWRSTKKMTKRIFVVFF